jgi:hypothetical protein
MKLISNYFEQIAGVEYYPIIVLILFFTLFIGILVMVMLQKNSLMNEFSRMPLEENEEINNIIKP